MKNDTVKTKRAQVMDGVNVRNEDGKSYIERKDIGKVVDNLVKNSRDGFMIIGQTTTMNGASPILTGVLMRDGDYYHTMDGDMMKTVAELLMHGLKGSRAMDQTEYLNGEKFASDQSLCDHGAACAEHGRESEVKESGKNAAPTDLLRINDITKYLQDAALGKCEIQIERVVELMKTEPEAIALVLTGQMMIGVRYSNGNFHTCLNREQTLTVLDRLRDVLQSDDALEVHGLDSFGPKSEMVN